MKKWRKEDMSENQAIFSPTLQINCSTNQDDKTGHVLLHVNHMAKASQGFFKDESIQINIMN